MANTIRSMGTTLEKVKSGQEQANLTLTSLTSIGEVSIEAEEIDTTTLDSNGAEYIQGNVSASEVSIGGYIKNATDEAQCNKLSALVQSGSVEAWIITYPSGAKCEFNAFVKSFALGEATTDGLNSWSGTLRVSGIPVYTESTGGGNGDGNAI